MKQLWRRLRVSTRSNGLFIELALLSLAGILAASAFSLLFTLKTSGTIYLDTVSRSAEQSLEQVKEKMETQNQTNANIVSTLRTNWACRSYLVSEDRSSVQAARMMFYFVNMLGLLNLSDETKGVKLVMLNSNGNIFYTGGYSGITLSSNQILNADFTRRAEKQTKKFFYRFVAGGFSNREEDKNCIVVTAAMANASDEKPYGYLYLIIGQAQLQEFYASLSNDASRLMLMDDNGMIISAENTSLIGKRDLNLLNAVHKAETTGGCTENVPFNGSDVSVVAKYLGNWGVHTVGIIDNKTAFAIVHEGSQYMVRSSLVIALFVAVLLFWAMRKRTKPLQRLVKHMSQVTEENTCAKIDIKGGYEVRQLANAYNVMMGTINRHIQDLIAAEKNKRIMELRSLRMQINPHFINNTLASIKFLIWEGQTDKATQGLDMFTSLLRGTISNEEEMIPLKDEVQNLERYVFLQKIRFGDNIRFEMHLDENAEDCLVPKLVLQPMIENAFFHAFPQVPQNGLICVFARVKGEQLLCDIIDNGCGIPKGPAKDGNSTGIGIKNVSERLRLLFGASYGVTISSEPEQGTIVTVRMPVQKL